MIKARIIYFIAMIASFLFILFHNKPIAYVLTLVILILPIISFLMLLIYRKKLEIIIKKLNDITFCCDKINFGILFKNKSLIMIPAISLKGVCKYSTYNKKEKFNLKAFVSGHQTSKINYEIIPLYRGLIEFEIKKIYIYDYLGIFKYKFKSKIKQSIIVIPRMKNENIEDVNNLNESEYEVFSQTQSGDDFSETFKIKEYTVGDNLKAIHWKLSSHSNNLMVREFSKPLAENILIFIDYNNYFDSQRISIAIINEICKLAISITQSYVNHGKNVSLIWFYDNQSESYIREISVKNQKEFEESVRFISCEKINFIQTDFSDLISLQKQRCINNQIHCITSNCDSKISSVTGEIANNYNTKISFHMVKNEDKENDNLKEMIKNHVLVFEYILEDQYKLISREKELIKEHYVNAIKK